MESALKRPRSRPLSPHLFVWRWQIWAIASITHRIAGVALYLGGMTMSAWFLAAVAMGPEHYAIVSAAAGSMVGQLFLVGLTWAVFQHMASGIRHLFMDTGAGFGRTASRRSAIATFVFSIALTAVLWSYIWSR